MIDKPDIILLQDTDGDGKWPVYIENLKQSQERRKSSLVLFPDLSSAIKAKEIIAKELKIEPFLLYRKQPHELEAWFKIKRVIQAIVVSTRSGVFAPIQDLDLIILDDEDSSVYKQDQVPHYHAREVAIRRAKAQGLRLIISATSPSLESIYLAKKNEIKYQLLKKNKTFPEVKICDTRAFIGRLKKGAIFSKVLEDSIYSALNEKSKILIFLNRKGFSTFAVCNSCGHTLRCPRCNINLVFYFKENTLSCHYCNFKMPPPSICPSCNAGYVKYSGTGTQKLESEVARLFPQARIKSFSDDNLDFDKTDIVIASSAITKQANLKFSLVVVLGIDSSLNRVDFRSSEKSFSLLLGLCSLTEGKVLIQSRLGSHHIFSSLIKKDANIFYEEELKQRKQLGFPPFKHIIFVKLRAKNEEKVKEASFELFGKLSKDVRAGSAKALSVNPAQPAKLRGNYCWQVLLSCCNVRLAVNALKLSLKSFSHSGIIVTVDVDPL